MGWRGLSVIDDRKREFRRAARSMIEVRLKAVAREIEKHTLSAMQRIIQPGLTARDAQAVIDAALPLAELMQPVSYEEAETLVSMRSRTSRDRPWHDNGRMESRARASSAMEPEDVDPEALRDDFRRLLD